MNKNIKRKFVDINKILDLGAELADKGWNSEAKQQFLNAIELNPNISEAHDNLGTILVEEGNFVGALNEYLHALNLDPENPYAYYNIGSLLTYNSKEMALDFFYRALKLDPFFTDARLNLAFSLAETGKIEEAIENYKIVLNENPEDHLARYELATLYLDKKSYNKAINHLKTILSADPENFEALLGLGICYDSVGILTESEEILIKADEVKENNFFVNFHLARIYTKLKKFEKAAFKLEKAISIDRFSAQEWVESDVVLHMFKDQENLKKVLNLL